MWPKSEMFQFSFSLPSARIMTFGVDALSSLRGTFREVPSEKNQNLLLKLL